MRGRKRDRVLVRMKTGDCIYADNACKCYCCANLVSVCFVKTLAKIVVERESE